MLRKVRICLAILVFALITLLFVDFTGTLHVYLGWLAKVQFLPAVLALNVVVVALLVLLTLVFGRIYCSVICPLGILQDILSSINRKKNHFCYSPAKSYLRYFMLGLLVLSIAFGIGSITAILAPYSSFGRMAQNFLQPVVLYANNWLAGIAEQHESYLLYQKEVWMRSLPTFIVAAVSFVVIAVLAIRNGRTYCNTICPVGTVLGYLARFSWFKIVIDEDKCKNCGKCARNCKAACIDAKGHSVDYSRCVTCGNCLQQCSFGAMKYAHKTSEAVTKPTAADKSSVSEGRRSFLIGAGTVIAATAMAEEEKKVDGGLAVIEDKIQPERKTQLTPPGSLSARNMATRCTGCQLCVSECPNDVLRPSASLMSLMQPTMSYERGYCRPECNRCATVCPAGAIQPITLADKSSTQIGHAVWVRKNCLPVAEGVSCGNCARHCPNGAIQMVHIDGDESKPMIPAVNESRCIGCGACEYVCPSRPFSAIYVEGHEVHKFN